MQTPKRRVKLFWTFSLAAADEQHCSAVINARFYAISTQRVEFDLKAYLRGSEKERADIYKILFDIGAITTDEIRQMEDMIQ
jgi:hypothetical protein